MYKIHIIHILISLLWDSALEVIFVFHQNSNIETLTSNMLLGVGLLQKKIQEREHPLTLKLKGDQF